MPEVTLKGEKRYKKILSLYEKALNRFFKKEYEKAHEKLEKLINDYKEEEKELIKKALVYKRLCENRINPPKISLKTIEDHIHYAVYTMNRKEYDESEKTLLAIEKKEKDNPKVNYLLSLLYALKEEKDKAISYLKKSIKKDALYKVYAMTNPDFAVFSEDEEFEKLTAKKEDEQQEN
jgi:predicted Zn-dependent protease